MRSAMGWFAGTLLLALAHSAWAAEQQAKLIERTTLEYPPAARRDGEEGVVTVMVEVRKDGSVGDTRLLATSGSSLLDEAGLESVRGWRFAPATNKKGKPIVTHGAVKVEFKLTDPEPRPETPWSESIPDAESTRLAAIWVAYRSYRGFHEEFLKKCEAQGLDTKAARAANRQFDAEADAKLGKLEQLLRSVLAADGLDPGRQFEQTTPQLDAGIKQRGAEAYDKLNGPDEQRRACENFLTHLGTVEGSFRSNQFYERLMAL